MSGEMIHVLLILHDALQLPDSSISVSYLATEGVVVTLDMPLPAGTPSRPNQQPQDRLQKLNTTYPYILCVGRSTVGTFVV
jgi:hypothetical protein